MIAGAYRLRVSNPYGAALSDAAVVQLAIKPEIIRQPQSKLVAAGSSTVLNVRATPDRPVASTQQDIEGVLAAMQREDPEFAYEVMAVRALPGFEAPEGSYLVDAVTRAYTDVCGRSPDVGPIPPFVLMGSDSGQMQSAGMAHGALIGPGKFSSSLADEYVEVDKIVAATKIYAATALRVCGYVE